MRKIISVLAFVSIFLVPVSSVSAYDNLNGGRFFNGESIFDGKSIYGNGALNRQRILGRIDGLRGFDSGISVGVHGFRSGSSFSSNGLRSDF